MAVPRSRISWCLKQKISKRAGEPPAVQKYERAGLDVVPSVERLMEFYAVETTYLALFLVLGALGPSDVPQRRTAGARAGVVFPGGPPASRT